MTEIPQIVEDLYNETVRIPDEKDWPEYLGSNPLFIRSLCSFCYGLRAGFQLAGALREEKFTLSEE